MDSASTPATKDSPSMLQILNIPELAAAITSFLDKKDISQLMQSSHGLHDIFMPLFYEHLDLTEKQSRLLTLPDSMSALSRNAGLVRSIRMRATFGIAYYDGVMAQRQQQQQQSSLEAVRSAKQPYSTSPFSSSSTTTESLQQPTIDTTALTPVPFSPFALLSKLVFVFTASLERPHRARVQAQSDNGTLVSKLCGILDFSPRLRSLSLSGIHIITEASLDHFAAALAGLTNLERLSLCLLSPDTDHDRFIITLFRHFPDMLTHLNLTLFFFSPVRGKVMEPLISPTNTHIQQQLHRQGPLRHLTYFSLVSKNSLNLDTFYSIVKSFPALTIFNIPRIESQGCFDTAAEMLVRSCPQLQDIHHSNGSHDKEGRMLSAVASRMDKDTLRSIYFSGLAEKERMLERIVERHFGSLNTIFLSICSTISAKSLQAILFHCPLLVSLEVSGDDPEKFKIPLKSIIAEPWASNKLKTLHLVIDIGDVDTLLQDKRDPTAWLLDNTRKNHLERLFRQIGKQLELEILELRVAVNEEDLPYDSGDDDDEDEYTTYKTFFFPGFLTLTDEKMGRFGFLELLVGLTNLHCLLGSLAVKHSRNGCTMGQRECGWIVEHWPKLLEASFYATKADVEAHTLLSSLQHLIKRRSTMNGNSHGYIHKHLPYKDVAFPGIIPLSDGSKGNSDPWEFVEHLAGLKKLDILKGSINLIPEDL
ncbi:hypothetical protein BGZ95_000391 [Linnemannia exigua]|uniref:F-box domain-containing protein n=1 Tax=Linnemannia exigua TaxID=604196 RepID=A0AAD4DLJ7_9FUNG|nr:hypothetical protein BGZ95_000391 [Linnemannia exigua]